MPDVRSMCAIGRRGQLGLKGRLPWEGESGPEYRADVERFWAQTQGHVLIAGQRVANEDGVIPRVREFAIRLVRHRHAIERASVVER